MKKLILAVLVLAATASMAQTNLQVMYDFGNSRKNVTSTLEMFKPDKWGDTFFFVDMEFNGDVKTSNTINEKQPSLAYMEIARCLKFWKGPFSAHLEYNGGLLLGKAANDIYNEGYLINNAYLAGVDYAWHDKGFTKFLNFKILYKNIQGKNPASFQLTGVWNLNYLNKKLTVSGFADFWREDNMNFTNAKGEVIVPTNTKYVFISEPQIWYNVNQNLSVGGEVEIATNFGSVDGWKVCPALGAKWNF
jgi:hypothetical protein